MSNKVLSGSNSSFTSYLQMIYEKYLPITEGRTTDILAHLKEADPNTLAISAVTINGDVHSVGDFSKEISIQSISKPFVYGMALSKLFTYGLALEDHGREEVLKRVDVEPTGDAYNAIIKVEESSKRPHNPMVNAGGIAVTSLIKGRGPAIRLNRILEMYQRYIGRQVFVDAPAFIAEQAANDRNWAISYLLKNFGMIEGDIQQTMDLYLQQCSAVINCLDLAMMGATLRSGWALKAIACSFGGTF
jgi:glutaminase